MNATTLHAAQSGDPQAIDAVISEARQIALSYARARLYEMPNCDLEDVAQEAALAVWMNLAEIEPDYFEAKCCHAAHNKHRYFKGLLRTQKRDTSRERKATDCVLTSAGGDPVNHAIAAETSQRMQASPVHGPVLVTLIEGGSASDIQARHDCSHQAAHGRIKRARAHAKKVLAGGA